MSKFLVELPEQGGIIDLVANMASFVGAEFRVVQTLETSCEQLARAVTALTGQILTAEEAEAVVLAKGSDIGTTPAIEKEDRQENAEVSGKFCEFCGIPIGKKRRICNKKECKNKLQRIYQAKWSARNAAEKGHPVVAEIGNEDGAAVVDDTAAAEVAEEAHFPFVPMGRDPVYEVLTETYLGMRFSHADLMERIRSGKIPEGTAVRAQPSGRSYEVRERVLAWPREEPSVPVSPGAVEMQPVER